MQKCVIYIHICIAARDWRSIKTTLILGAKDLVTVRIDNEKTNPLIPDDKYNKDDNYK